jgi:hypothetical protein
VIEYSSCEKKRLKNGKPDLDFARNCVFIDEAGFNLHTQRNHGRSRKGAPAKGIVPTEKGITFTLLGAISQTVSTSKMREANDATATVVN